MRKVTAMTIFKDQRIKVAGALLVVVLALGIVGASLAIAGNSDGYSEVSSVEELAKARGVVHDWAETSQPAPTGIRDWIIGGEWALNCHQACAQAKLRNIDFDMAFAMARPLGASSHGHTFWDFLATSVEVVEAGSTTSLVIEGTITGSGHIGTDGITIILAKNSNGHFTFFFKMDNGNSITTEVDGVVVESSGRHGRDDDDN